MALESPACFEARATIGPRRLEATRAEEKLTATRGRSMQWCIVTVPIGIEKIPLVHPSLWRRSVFPPWNRQGGMGNIRRLRRPQREGGGRGSGTKYALNLALVRCRSYIAASHGLDRLRWNIVRVINRGECPPFDMGVLNHRSLTSHRRVHYGQAYDCSVFAIGRVSGIGHVRSGC